MKSYTDIEQSKKLVNILPIESADMCYGINDGTLEYDNLPWLIPYHKYTAKEFYIPCWSLAALLDVLPTIKKYEDIANPFIAKTPDGEYYIVYATLTKEVYDSSMYDNPVDACYEMILRLHELKML